MYINLYIYENNVRHSTRTNILQLFFPFKELENLIRPLIQEAGNDVPLRKKILLTIWTVATPESFRSVADRFGVRKSTAHTAFKEVIAALNELMPQFVRWPNADECDESERVSSSYVLFYEKLQ